MYMPQQKQVSKNRNYINIFGGYNHNSRISESEFYDMKNMTMNNYPVISSRDSRECKLRVATKEYDQVEFTKEQKLVEESLSKKYAVYTYFFELMENARYEFDYEVELECVESFAHRIYVEREDGLTRELAESKEFVVPEEYINGRIVITAQWNNDNSLWTEDNVDLFVKNFSLKRKNETIRGMVLKNGYLAYMIRDTLYWKDKTFDFSNYSSSREEQQLISYGAYIMAFPMGIYINTNNLEDFGYLGASCETQEKISYDMCNIDGAGYSYITAEKAPEEPKDGQYWMKHTADGDALYQWSETMAMWTAVSTTYIRIKVNGNEKCFDVFKERDSIFIENSEIEALDGVNTITSMGVLEENGTKSAYIVVTGIMDKSMEQESSVVFERKIPELDYVCVSNNRIWGCHYGMTEEGMVNEIYACKLGDPKNWYSYQGTAQDSYTLSLGDDGEFTGAHTYQGYPLFFKENNIYKIYGSYPAAYQLSTYDCRGVQKGSSKSIAIVDEYLVYKSINDICVFDGNYPVSLSDKLGKRRFTNGAAGAYMSKYYISMKDEKGVYAIYVYDFKSNLWVRDEELKIDEFVSTKSGELYGRTKTGIISFGINNDNLGLEELSEDELIDWMVETGTYGFDSPDRKFITNIKIRASVHPGARMKLEVYYDDDNKWREHWIEKGGINSDGRIRNFEIPILPVSCDTMRMKLSGVGKVEIYSIAKRVEEAGR